MKALSGAEVAGYLRGLIHAKTQVQSKWVDLTAKGIYVLEDSGSLDFGGSELEIAGRRECPKEKRKPEDKYSWWELGEGNYIMELNEIFSLPEGRIGVLQPRPEFLANGASHPTLLISPGEELPLVPIIVGKAGVKIKENARVSRLFIFKVVD
jgi:deoxycytidine triphosphate deaminase